MYARKYVENDLLDKTPVELIRLLYSKAIDKLQLATQLTRTPEIRKRGAAVARAMEIIAALQAALNPEAGGALSLQLARLYDYIQRLLIEAAADPAAVGPLEEASRLLGNLYEGWKECEPAPAREPQPETRYPLDPLGLSSKLQSDDQDSVDQQLPPALPLGGYINGHVERVWTL
jgi:flagellar protein FliS